MSGLLYVVATPIGNLGDMTYRAVDILKSVDAILAEDTRQTKKLLDHYGIAAKLIAVHEHNERQISKQIMDHLASGESLALVSDAGTPLISDPGYPLVSACREAGFDVKTIPGACAVAAALSISGLPTDQFKFMGFLPHKSSARQKVLQSQAVESATLVFYESTHRIMGALQDISAVYGDRQVVIAKELTKQFERILSGTADNLHAELESSSELQKGEFVLLVSGAEDETSDDAALEQVLKPLLEALPLKQAAAVASEITGEKKNRLYQLALKLRELD